MNKSGDAIFISYRREDSAAFAGRLFDRLNEHFGGEKVFIDVDDIEMGQDFVQVIEEKLAASRVLLVIIGKEWLRPPNDVGEDFVHREIRAALRRDLKIIPVLIEGATMPEASALPPDLTPFTRRNAVVIRDSHFHDDVAGLMQTLMQQGIPNRNAATGAMAGFGKKGWRLILGALALLAVPGGIYWYRTTVIDPATLAGAWRAEVVTRQGYRYPLDFHFILFDRELTGTVRYPTGLGVIGESRIDGSRITFQTEHVPQFASEKAVIHFRGTVASGKIEFLMRTNQGQEQFVAEKRGP